MIRLFQFVLLLLGLSLVALGSAIVTMRFAIHGAEVTIPNFRGMTPAEALMKASELGVEMSIDNRFYSAEVPAGRILSQSPAPETQVRREWHVRAAESLGPQTVAIPDLVGEPQRAATMELRRHGLEVGSVAQMPSVGVPPETVIAQDPIAGAAGVDKPSVGLVVSGPAPPDDASFVMPSFIGQQYATAVATIVRAGLKIAPGAEQIQPSDFTGPALPGTVIGQTPPAGFSVNTRQPIELVVAR